MEGGENDWGFWKWFHVMIIGGLEQLGGGRVFGGIENSRLLS